MNCWTRFNIINYSPIICTLIIQILPVKILGFSTPLLKLLVVKGEQFTYISTFTLTCKLPKKTFVEHLLWLWARTNCLAQAQ